MSKTNETPEETYLKKAWADYFKERFGRKEKTIKEEAVA